MGVLIREYIGIILRNTQIIGVWGFRVLGVEDFGFRGFRV